MDIRFFDRKLIFCFRQEGRQNSEDRCVGHSNLLPRNLLNYHFTGIIAYMHKKKPLGRTKRLFNNYYPII